MVYDVITVGSSTIDVFVDTISQTLNRKFDHKSKKMLAYPLGTKLLIRKLNFTIGGGGTNTAVALARLGNKVAYLGKVGKDENGDLILKSLKKEKIDFIGTRSDEQSGYSVILDSKAHDRTILTHKGCNDHLSFKEINQNKLKAKWFYFSSMVKTSFKTLEKLSTFAKKHNIKVAFNPSSYICKKGIKFLERVIKNTYLLVLNKEEASNLVRGKTIEDLLRKLVAKGPKIAIITNGAHSLTAFDGRAYYKLIPRKIKVVEATGAGDAFASSFLSAFIRTGDIKTGMKTGLINAQSVIQHHGAKNKLLTQKDLGRTLKKKRIKVRTYKGGNK